MDNKIKKILAVVSKPGQYTGGEYGCIIKEAPENLLIALSFPDLYEIGMSNVAIKILYNLLNSLEGVTCERVFAPAPDMEEELRKRDFPLFSLETGRPLADFDLIAFSVGYELSITNILNILNLGKLPLQRTQRNLNDPIIIAGGPVLSNPLPFGRFLDFAYIGEGEDFVLATIPRLVQLKKDGAGRSAMRDVLKAHPALWNPAEPTRVAKKAVFQGFAATNYNAYLPVSNIKIVQDHGNVEIMRGCPNGCRFCHAGMLYRPVRMKGAAAIDREIAAQVFDGGYREITLASLSTGDYTGIDRLVTTLGGKYGPCGVSFALPSLRINSLSLDILQTISSVRKSGLTFAVETPQENWQRGLNKEVSREKIIQLLENAQKRGWRLAKFYFMLGLPLYEEDEIPGILDFLLTIKSHTRMKLNINISTFVPKPHTPFQWAAQLEEDEALRRIQALKAGLKGQGFKLGYHSPAASRIEGLIARGDERVGEIVEQAYLKGARLDAWEEHFNRLLWQEVIEQFQTQSDKYDIDAIYGAKSFTAPLNWDPIDIGVSKDYLLREYKQAQEHLLSAACAPRCPDYCGACKPPEHKVMMEPKVELPEDNLMLPADEPQWQKLLISFSKQGRSVFLSHLNCMNIFERAFMRGGYKLKFTEGFNPKPKMEFAHPLSLGIASQDEIMQIEIGNYQDAPTFIQRMNDALPVGFKITRVKVLQPYVVGNKKTSLSSLFWGALYQISSPDDPEIIQNFYRSIAGNIPPEFSEAILDAIWDNGVVKIKWKQTNKKGCNVLSFIEKILQQNPFITGVEICRIQTFAKASTENEISYFEIIS